MCRRRSRASASARSPPRIAADSGAISASDRVRNQSLAPGIEVDVSRRPSAAASRSRGAGRRVQRHRRPVVVEADVEARPRLAGNDVEGGIADIDAGDLEVRRLEVLAAVVERAVSSAGGGCAPGAGPGCRQDADRRRGPACRTPMIVARQAAAPADLDRVAERAREVGSPTSAASKRGPVRSAQSSSLTVPLIAGPSSSPVISSDSVPFGSPGGDEGRGRQRRTPRCRPSCRRRRGR